MTASVQQAVPPRQIRLVTKLLLLEILLFCAVCAWVFAGKDLAPFHGDEATYIRMSRDYDYLVHQRNLGRILYRPDPVEGRMEQEVRITTGSITTFCIGFARRLAGLNGENVNGFWRWNSSPAEAYEVFLQNVAAGKYPNPDSLYVSRIPSSLFGILSIPLLYMAMLKLTESRLAAVTAVILLATSPMFLIHVRRAMQEGVKLFSLTLCLYLAARAVEALRARSASKRTYCLLGIAAGFTLAAKQDAAAALVAIYSGLALIAFLDRGTPRLFRNHLAGLAASAVLAFTVFFAMMPVWWEWWANIVILLCVAVILFCAASIGNAPVPRLWIAPMAILIILSVVMPSAWKKFPEPLRIMIEARQAVLKSQIGYRKKNNIPYLNTYMAKADFLAQTIFSSAVMDRNSTRFNIVPMILQMQKYRASILSGRHDLWIVDLLLGLLFTTGVWVMLRRLAGADLLILSLFSISSLFIFLTTPLPYDRYYLILQVPYTMICGIGAHKFAAIIRVKREPITARTE